MLVRTIIPHESRDGAIHGTGDEYELNGLELELRRKDGIVRAIGDAPVNEVAEIAKLKRTAPTDETAE